MKISVIYKKHHPYPDLKENQSELKTVFKDSKLIKEYTLSEIREIANSTGA